MTSKFNKRHYEAIALAMQEARTFANTREQFNMWTHTVAELARAFKRDNSRFIHDRFAAACEPGANVRLRTNYKIVDGDVANPDAVLRHAYEQRDRLRAARAAK